MFKPSRMNAEEKGNFRSAGRHFPATSTPGGESQPPENNATHHPYTLNPQNNGDSDAKKIVNSDFSRLAEKESLPILNSQFIELCLSRELPACTYIRPHPCYNNLTKLSTHDCTQSMKAVFRSPELNHLGGAGRVFKRLIEIIHDRPPRNRKDFSVALPDLIGSDVSMKVHEDRLPAINRRE